MSRAFLLYIAITALIGAACGGAQSTRSTDPARGGAADSNAPAPARVVALFERLSADLEAASADCDRIAAVLSTWTDDHRDDYAELSARARASTLAAEQGQRYRERLRAALDVVVGTASSCGDHPGAQAAFTRFDVLVDPRQ